MSRPAGAVGFIFMPRRHPRLRCCAVDPDLRLCCKRTSVLDHQSAAMYSYIVVSLPSELPTGTGHIAAYSRGSPLAIPQFHGPNKNRPIHSGWTKQAGQVMHRLGRELGPLVPCLACHSGGSSPTAAAVAVAVADAVDPACRCCLCGLGWQAGLAGRCKAPRLEPTPATQPTPPSHHPDSRSHATSTHIAGPPLFSPCRGHSRVHWNSRRPVFPLPDMDLPTRLPRLSRIHPKPPPQTCAAASAHRRKPQVYAQADELSVRPPSAMHQASSADRGSRRASPLHWASYPRM